MVCQAASKTKFRTLKHENGVAGFSTIIVRVIVCFQHLDECQVFCFQLMEKDLESWLPREQLDEQIPNAKSLNLSFNDVGMRNSRFPSATPCTVAVPTNNRLLTLGSIGPPNVKPGQSKEPYGWFYCLPRSRQGLVPGKMLDDKSVRETSPTSEVPAPARGSKQFLVFDQSYNKTTMMFSSGIGTSIPWPTSWSRKPTCFFDSKEGELGNGSDGLPSRRYFADDLSNDHGTNEGSHMCEDSEEINALLYSDEDEDEDEDYSDDGGEETSTGHSPVVMAAYEKRNWFEEEGDDEVASSVGHFKRRKLSENDYQVPLVTYSTGCVKGSRSADYEEDAESSCAGSKPIQFNDVGSLPSNKRVKWKKIRETVTILKTILPDGKGKDAATVLDEAINYLKTLKFKAESLRHSECSD